MIPFEELLFDVITDLPAALRDFVCIALFGGGLTALALGWVG